MSEIKLSTFDSFIAIAFCSRNGRISLKCLIKLLILSLAITKPFFVFGITLPLVIPDLELHPNRGIFNMLASDSCSKLALTVPAADLWCPFENPIWIVLVNVLMIDLP